MKKLKLDHALAQLVRSGQQNSTWRMHDDKDLSLNDQALLIDKVDPAQPSTWKAIGVATIDAVAERRLGDISLEDLRAQGFESRDAMLAQYRSYYGSNVTLQTPVKMLGFRFSPSIPDGSSAGAAVRIDKVIIYADGGSRGNPGPSASGYVVYDEHRTLLADRGVYLGITTNNQAEYMALKLALEEARSLGAREAHVYMDSMLVVNQMRGIFKVRNRDLWPIHDSVRRLCQSFERVDFTQVPRASNKAADAAVNAVLDAHQHDQAVTDSVRPE